MKGLLKKLKRRALGKSLTMVFRIHDVPGFIAMVVGRDGTGNVYQGKSDELTLLEGVQLKVYKDGNVRIIDVFKGTNPNPSFDLMVNLNEYSRMHSWTLGGALERFKLLRPNRYTLTIDGKTAVVSEK